MNVPNGDVSFQSDVNFEKSVCSSDAMSLIDLRPSDLDEHEPPRYALSQYFPLWIKLVITVIIFGTVGLLIFSNMHRAEHVDVILTPSITSDISNDFS